MAHLEATVASALKNWYINFFFWGLQVPGNAKWCQNTEIFRPQGPRRFLAIFQKIGFFENLVKIGFWSRFGSIWAPESSSA